MSLLCPQFDTLLMNRIQEDTGLLGQVSGIRYGNRFSSFMFWCFVGGTHPYESDSNNSGVLR